MSGIPESREGQETARSSSSPAVVVPPASCRKKKSEVNEGFVKDIISHMDDFVHASYDEHMSCLQKTFRKFVGTNKAVETSASTPPPKTVSALPTE